MKQEEKLNFSAYILAGGKSSRMGQDKGLMLLNGKPLVNYIIEQLQSITNDIIIVSDNPEYKNFGLEVIPDLIKDIGPVGGIYTALSHSENEYNFMISCDMPLIHSEAVNYLFENVGDSQIILPIHHEKIEPLFGFYNKSCLPLWKELIDTGLIKMQALVQHFNLVKLNVNSNGLFDKSMFTNINTREDFENLVQARENKLMTKDMEIHILAFGQIAELIEKSVWIVSDVESTDDLKERLFKEFPELETMKFAIAVNKKIINQNMLLSSGDTLALLPPFSGG